MATSAERAAPPQQNDGLSAMERMVFCSGSDGSEKWKWRLRKNRSNGSQFSEQWLSKRGTVAQFRSEYSENNKFLNWPAVNL